MAAILVDTDVLVDHLRGARELRVREGDAVHYSVVTRAELRAGSEEQQSAVSALLAPMREIAVDGPIADAAGAIRRDTGVGMADALIAASALANGLRIVTRNRRDFDRIDALSVRSPDDT